jgi:hypothetical protein
MLYRLLADGTVVTHALFIIFVVIGGFVAWRWRWLAWVHIPCAAWGALIEFAGWICPLTPLENRFRALAGEAGYEGGFIEHYLTELIYVEDWSLAVRVVLGTFVVVVNVAAYWRFYRLPSGGT